MRQTTLKHGSKLYFTVLAIGLDPVGKKKQHLYTQWVKCGLQVIHSGKNMPGDVLYYNWVQTYRCRIFVSVKSIYFRSECNKDYFAQSRVEELQAIFFIDLQNCQCSTALKACG